MSQQKTCIMNLSRKKLNAIQATEYSKGFGTDKQSLENIIEKKIKQIMLLKIKELQNVIINCLVSFSQIIYF